MASNIRKLWPVAAAALGLAGWRAVRDRRAGFLEDRTVFITGGSRGLGLVLARHFGERGARIAICARDERALDGARQDLASRGIEAVALTCDVSDPEAVEETVARVRDRLGPVDVLVNNASIIQVGPLATMEREDFERAMDVNFGGTLNASLAVLPGMIERGRGRIVNITSIGGELSIPHLLPYSCAKFAAVGLSEGLRAELAGTGVKVTTVVPGLMRTGSPVNALFRGRAEREFEWFSLGDALPITAMSAERAARRIVRATATGESRVTLSWQAKLVRLAHDLFPTAVVGALGLVNRLLPDAGPDPEAPGTAGAGRPRHEEDREVRGMRLASRLSPSFLTGLMNRAARRNNEYGGEPRPAPRHAERVGLAGAEGE